MEEELVTTETGKLLGMASTVVEKPYSFPAMTIGEIKSGYIPIIPILNNAGTGVGSIETTSIVFAGGVFLNRVGSTKLLNANGDYFLDERTGYWRVIAGATTTPTATYNIRVLCSTALIADIGAMATGQAVMANSLPVVISSDQSTLNIKIVEPTLLAEGEITVITAGTPEPMPSNTNAKYVRIINNNIDGKTAAVGKLATVDALSIPQIGDILQSFDSTTVSVVANSNEVYVDATVSGSKFTYKIYG